MGGGEVIKEGWLVKSPPLEGGGLKVWRKRYFKLRSSKVLEYYKNEAADQQKGVINLEDCTSVHSDLSHKKYKFVFDIETRTRVFYLVAQDQQEMMQWVDVLCRVCGLTVHQEEEVATPQSAGANLYSSHYASGSSTLTPNITPPLYSTTTAVRSATLGAQTSFNAHFQPSEGPPMESLYTLAQAAEADVQRELGQEQQVPAGVPLMEALATKGIGPRTSSLSSASGGDALTGHVSDSSLSPCHEPSARGDGTSNEYMPHPQRGGAYRPTPKPRSTSMIPLSERLSANDISGSFSGNPRAAETLQNGYMKPRQAASPASNYDQLPGGPPRPAPSPRQRSALLREDSSGTTATSSGPSGHTYINMQRSLDSQLPPPVNRSNKPPEPSPPMVNRRLKPEGSLSSADDPDSPPPPSCPVRISSLSASKNTSLDLAGSSNEREFATTTSSSMSIDDNAEGFVGFSATDLPKRSRSTMKYTQVQFHSDKGTPMLVEPSSPSSHSDELSKRDPVPVPRPGVSRVNYSDVDLTATRALAEAGKVTNIQINLAEAERRSLKEKPYINVNREGVVDDNSDPDYYTYMRSQVYDQALDAYNAMDSELDNSEEFPTR